MSLIKPQSLLVLLSLLTGTLSQSSATLAANLNPGGTGCIDRSGYLSCYAKNSADAGTCATQCKNNPSLETTCLDTCGVVQLAANIGCWLTSCWNEVYSCGYQGTAIQYLDSSDRVQGSFIPFYPAPNSAPGGCVCNLGDYWGNTTVATNKFPCNNIFGTAAQEDCQCCFDSSLISNIYNICPSNDLSVFGINKYISDMQLAYNNSASNKCSVLAKPSACQSSFSIDTYATTYVNPGALPPGFPGTVSLSNTGSSSITSPGLGPTYIFSIFPAYTTTIVAAAYNAGNAAAGPTGVSSAGGGQGSVATSGAAVPATGGSATAPPTGSTTAGSPAAATTTHSSAINNYKPPSAIFGVAIAAVMFRVYLRFL